MSQVAAWLGAAAAVAVVVGWVIPAIGIRALLPALAGSTQLVTNYRGRSIPTGLGLVWAIWAVGVGVASWIGTLILTSLQIASRAADPASSAVSVFALHDVTSLLSLTPWALVLGTCLFGLVDDVYGDASAKGFRGHVSALMHGRLTTGGLKMLGIGVLSFVVTAGLARTAIMGGPQSVRQPVPLVVLTSMLSAMAIALSANLVNLMDLRPGRALKSYSLLAVVGIAVIAVITAMGQGTLYLRISGVPDWQTWPVLAAVVGTLLVLALGPVFAVWRLDLGELGMLGDAGANAMGALAGFLLIAESPLWLIAVIVVVLLALNLASERFSFTKVIESVAFLRWIDGLGRLRLRAEQDEVSDR